MNEISQTYVFEDGVREDAALIVGVCGASGSGKTLSALMIARGLAGGDDSKIGVIDTESGRALHYAPARGEKPSATKFGFRHLDLRPPFTPEAYMGAIRAAEAAGFPVIMIDSCSHEWEGEGGLHDEHDDLVSAAVERQREQALEKGWRFDEVVAADKASIACWKKPKERHKKFISRLLQCKSHLVLCLRADEKMRMETIEEERNGRTFKKTVIIAAKDLPPHERWQPICEKRMPYELTVSLLLTPNDPGTPIPLKLQAQHMGAFPMIEGKFSKIGEASGAALAQWAKGSGDGTPPDPATAAEKAAKQGVDAFRAHWAKLPKADRAKLQPNLAHYQQVAKAADTATDDIPDDPFATQIPPAPEQQPSDNEGAEVVPPASAPSDNPVLSPAEALERDGDARAAAGLKALEAWIVGLSAEEFESIKGKQKAWRATALRADAARAPA